MMRTPPVWAGQAFGSSLKDLARAGQSPHVLLDSLRFLATRGLTTPSLFSSPVNKRQLLALKEAYDAGRRALRSARVVSNLDPSAAANLLLLWLGALPESLFPAEHIPELLDLHSRADVTRAERVASMRCLLKRTEPFIVEALFPLFELLHHYWINQPQREETLGDLASIFAAPVFGMPADLGASSQASAVLVEATAMLIAEYRPLFTQPYNLQRYAADLQRQATAAEAKAIAAEARALEQASLGVNPLRINVPCSVSDLSTSPPDWMEAESPLLTPRRMGALSVMEPVEPLLGCSPDDSSAIWSYLNETSGLKRPAESFETDDMEALLDGMLHSTVAAAFPMKGDAALEHAAMSLLDGYSFGPSTDASTSPFDISREASDSDGELPNTEELIRAAAAGCAALQHAVY